MALNRIHKIQLQMHFLWIAIAIISCTIIVHTEQSVSQFSPKSESLNERIDNEWLATTIISGNAETNDKSNLQSSQLLSKVSKQSESDEMTNVKLDRIPRSASPVRREDDKTSIINSVEEESGRYFSMIQPTNTFRSYPNQYDSQSMTKDFSRSSSSTPFLLKRGPRLISSTSPLSQPAHLNETVSTSIQPTNVSPIELQTASSNHNLATNHGRQNPNPDIQDIITGIVKLLNGNVNVHANTQPLQASRRPHTRINNRGPPRISEAQVDDNFESKPPLQKPTPSTIRPPILPYIFDRPEPPARPFISGVPLPEQIVPTSNNNYRPQFISQPQQNRPPWQRPRPRPPIITNINRRPILTPPPYKFSSRPVQALLPPDIDPPHVNDEYDESSVSDLLENEHLPEKESTTTTSTTTTTTTTTTEKTTTTAQPIEEKKITTPAPVKEELPKKKDKTKKPTISSSAPQQPQRPMIVPSKSFESKIMKTTIHSTSEVHILQNIVPTNSPSIILEPSEGSSSSKTEFLSIPSTIKTPDLATEIKTSSSVQKLPSSSSTIEATSKQQPQTTPSAFHPRPGIVLDDPEFKPGGQAKLQNRIQPTRTLHRPPVSPTSNVPPGYGEIFDVTLSAIQGPGNGGASSGLQTINIKPYAANNDIIVSASGEDTFVSIDGKRTYINLFGESTPAPTKQSMATQETISEQSTTIQPTKTTKPEIIGTGYAVVDTETQQKQSSAATLHGIVQKQTSHAQTHPTRPQYRPRTQQPPVRIDTCIVGDDSTCDLSQNEKCKTETGVSSCHCRPGYGRRKHREPCRRVISILMSMRVDKFYERKIIWDKQLADKSSEAYTHLSYESIRAIDSAMSMTPFSDEFMGAKVNKIYNGDASQGSAGVFVNMTIEVEENGESIRPAVKSEIQKHLLGVIHRRNNNIGNSVLYVETPAGSISNLQDVDECSSSELNDCHAEATCTNVWGNFRCQCRPGFRDPWSDQVKRAGRECQTCQDSYCNNRGTCSYDPTGTQQVCECVGSYYGNQCEVDGEVLAVAIGASVIAVIIIVLTLICLVMWSRRWHREQKEAMGSPIFGYMSGTALGAAQMKSNQQSPYHVTLEDRMRWAQIADVMAQTNHYAAEPVASSRPPSAMYGYPNIQMMSNMQTLSMAGTLPLQHPGATLPPIPMPRYGIGIHTRSSGMRTLENSSSSEEEDRTDLLGRNFHVPRPKSRSNGSIANQSGIYYDVDYEPSGGEIYGGTTTTTTTSCNNNSNGPNNSMMNGQGIPMSTYPAGRMPNYFMK